MKICVQIELATLKFNEDYTWTKDEILDMLKEQIEQELFYDWHKEGQVKVSVAEVE